MAIGARRVIVVVVRSCVARPATAIAASTLARLVVAHQIEERGGNLRGPSNRAARLAGLCALPPVLEPHLHLPPAARAYERRHGAHGFAARDAARGMSGGGRGGGARKAWRVSRLPASAPWRAARSRTHLTSRSAASASFSESVGKLVRWKAASSTFSAFVFRRQREAGRRFAVASEGGASAASPAAAGAPGGAALATMPGTPGCILPSGILLKRRLD